LKREGAEDKVSDPSSSYIANARNEFCAFDNGILSDLLKMMRPYGEGAAVPL